MISNENIETALKIASYLPFAVIMFKNTDKYRFPKVYCLGFGRLSGAVLLSTRRSDVRQLPNPTR